jgi:hypothetical protein
MAMQTDNHDLLHPFCRRAAIGIQVFPSDRRDPLAAIFYTGWYKSSV